MSGPEPTRPAEEPGFIAPASLPLAPLVDMVFILLMFVMVALNRDERSLHLDLPALQSPETASTEQVLTIEIDAGGTVLFEGSVVNAADLRAHPRLTPDSGPVRVRSDRRASFGDVMRVLDALREAGVGQIEIQGRAP
ncbi:MAG: biopolymer transporter ExbD [Spirochaetales bacterium]|nr:biopolymer transporter ExbD [Spirochaetales bacterium]MCP5486535.1 biopolymer transporter ExbD [Spirochaetales bacterium]